MITFFTCVDQKNGICFNDRPVSSDAVIWEDLYKEAFRFQKGIEMIFTQFAEILKKNGLTQIDTTNVQFDPNFHQAVMRVENPELEDGTIVAELQKGYMAKGRVIRPAMVQVVGNG